MKELEGSPCRGPRSSQTLGALLRETEQGVLRMVRLAAGLNCSSAADESRTLRRSGMEEPDEEAAENARGTYWNEFALLGCKVRGKA